MEKAKVSYLDKFKSMPIYFYEILILVAMMVFASITINGFFSKTTIIATLLMASFLGIVSGGQTFAVVIGQADLSVASMIGVANVLAGFLTGKGWPFGATLLVIVGIAVALGAFNAFISKYFKIYPMITTMATGSIMSGLLLIITNGSVNGTCPKWISSMVALNGHVGPIPIPPVILVWLAYCVIVILLMYKTPWGKKLYATGVNPKAAELSLVNTTAIWIAVFVLCSVSAAITGILLAGFSGSAYFNVGDPYLFNSLAAVVLGGTVMTGGRGGNGRTIFGSIFIILLNTIMIGFGIDSSMQQAVLGVAIIIMLSLYGRQPSIANRM